MRRRRGGTCLVLIMEKRRKVSESGWVDVLLFSTYAFRPRRKLKVVRLGLCVKRDVTYDVGCTSDVPWLTVFLSAENQVVPQIRSVKIIAEK